MRGQVAVSKLEYGSEFKILIICLCYSSMLYV